MSVAVLSLIEIISLAASLTVVVLPSGRPVSPSSPRLFHSGLIVSLVFQLSPPSRIFSATAPSTYSLKIEPIGRTVSGATACATSHLPRESISAARKPTRRGDLAEPGVELLPALGGGGYGGGWGASARAG